MSRRMRIDTLRRRIRRKKKYMDMHSIADVTAVAGSGTCGGFYRMGKKAPLAIYCVDADIDSKDQQGILSDLGVLKAGETLLLDSSSHHGAEAPGSWRLRQLIVRPIGP